MPTPDPSRRPVLLRAAVLLGLLTVGAYGVTYYAIGVLIPEIARDTGWSAGLLSAGYAAGAIASGLVALGAGRLLDQQGSRLILAGGLTLGAGALLASASAREPWQFLLAWGIGGSAVAGTLYYNVTMPIVTRLYPAERVAALSVLTLLGALASPIFSPLTGVLTEAWGWRITIRLLVVLMLLAALPAALLVRAPAARVVEGSRSSLREALRDPAVTRTLAVLALAGVGSSALVLHQVAAMQAAGLSLALAATIAGVRGAFQIPGRLLLPPLTRRAGTRGGLAVCYVAGAGASMALVLAQWTPWSLAWALVFMVLGGMSLGLLAPLNGLLQAEVYGDRHLGTLTGVSTVLGGIAQGLGAWGAGWLADRSGSYALAIGAVAVVQIAGIAVLAWQGSAARRHEDWVGTKVPIRP